MKITVFLIITSLFFGRIEAQTFSEFFSQRKTQKKYLLQQIAALQVYAGYLQKGYAIAKEGLGVIDEMKKGEFNLHDAIFGSLKKVSAVVRANSRLGEIGRLQNEIIQLCTDALKQAKASGLFSSGEIAYGDRVFTKLIQGANQDMKMLASLTTDDVLELTADERLRQLDQLNNDIQDKYAFACAFSNELSILLKQKSTR